MFDVGTGEILVILVAALLLFGGGLPEVARSLGRSVSELKRGLGEATRPLAEARLDLEREIEEEKPAGGKGGGAAEPEGPGGA